MEALPPETVVPGWQRWSGEREAGLRDARQAADLLQAVGAVLVAEDADQLRLLPGLPASEWGQALTIPGLVTAWGRLAIEARRDGRDWVLRLEEGLQLPPAGLVIDWPWKESPGHVLVDGQPASWGAGRLQLDHVPREIRLALPASVE